MLVGALAASLAANTQAGLIHRYSFTTSGADSVGSAPASLLNGAAAANEIYDTQGSVLGLGAFLNNADATGSSIQFTNYLSSSSNYQFIALPSNTITNAKNLTVESWFYAGDSTANMNPSTNWARIFDFGDNTTTAGQGVNFIQFTPWGNNNSPAAKLEFKIGSSDIVISNAPSSATSSSSYSLSGYHHAACVFDCSNSLMQLYIDGALASQTTTTNQIANVGTNALWLGRSEWSGDYYFYGYIDEFRIYDRALSAVEIMADFVVGTTNAAPVAATVLSGLDSVSITGPSSIIEQYQSNVVVNASFGSGTYNVALLNAPGYTLTSSDTTVATVDQIGNIRAVKPGTTQITASYGGKTATLSLTVTADTAPPVVTSANTKNYDTLVELTFSKILDTNTATTIANYVIDGGAVSVTKALLVTNDASTGVGVVRLITSTFGINATHTVVINNVKDTDVSANKIAANTSVNFGPVAGAPLAYRIYFGTDGYSVSSITNGMTNASFPYAGGRIYSMANGLTDSGSKGDNYIGVVDGWLVAPEDGSYAFGIASDDESAFYLSADSSPANLPKYANIYQSGYASTKNFALTTNSAWYLQNGTTTTNWSGWSTNLAAGQKYYFRYIHHNGTGSDQCDVTWAKSDSAALPTTFANGITNIQAKYIIPELPTNYTLAITNQPTNASGYQGRTVILSSGAYGVPTYVSVQWYKNGLAVAGATNAIYTNTSVKLSDAGTYYAVFSNYIASVQSASATLTVTPDTTPPTATLVWTTLGNSVIVNFSEQLDASSATTYANYVLTNKAGAVVAITNAVLDTTASNVTLYVGTQLTTNFTLTISGVKDLASNTIVKVTKPGYYYGAAYGMISYWPLDTNVGFTTPDVIRGYDFTLYGMTTNSSGAVTNLVPGVKGNCLYFNGTSCGYYLASSNDAIPVISKQKNFTISLWVKADGTAQNDARFFYEGYNASLGGSANQPFWSLQTLNSAHVYTYIRQDSGTVRWFKPASTASPLDGAAWHHILWTETTSIDGANTVTANCYIDGVRDTGMEGSATNGISATVEAIGAFWRQSIGGGTKCYIDEVALWNRALGADEIQLVYTNGVPTPVIIPQTLVIKSFTAQLPAVAAGTPVTLNWSVSKDATQITITPDVGDVTAATSAGLGSVTLTPTATKTYTLTVTRGVESITQTLQVPVVASVAAGWELIDNFDRYTAGASLGSPWVTYIDGTFNVVNYNGNNMVGAGGSAIQGLNLGAFSIPENQVGTLFYRFIATNAAAQSNDQFYVGLSDLTPRYAGEAWGTIGDGVSIENPVDVPVMVTKDGFYLDGGTTTTNTTYTNASYSFANGQVYNVWIDITNDTVANLDKYDVYVAADGSERTLVFSQIRSDRNPIDTSIYGPVQTGLLRVFLDSQNASGSTLLIDDLYLSFGSFRSTVPAPFGFTPLVGGVKPTITAVVSGNSIILSWDAANGAGYTLQSSATVDGTFTADSATPTTTGSTTSVTIPLSGTAKFYRLKQ